MLYALEGDEVGTGSGQRRRTPIEEASSGSRSTDRDSAERTAGRRYAVRLELTRPCWSATCEERGRRDEGWSTDAETLRSRIGRQVFLPDGSTRCRLLIPIGHPASRRIDEAGEVFEVENEIEYAAGPGSQELRMVDPASGEEQPVGNDLLPTSEEEAARISADNLSEYLRRARAEVRRDGGAHGVTTTAGGTAAGTLRTGSRSEPEGGAE